jgi:methylated-DNA-[protein]-cysteine S-methyltransferase
MIGVSTVESPVGPLTLGVRGGQVCVLHFGPEGVEVRAALTRWYPGEPVATAHDAGGATTTALRAYFAGEIQALDGIGVELNGTPFQLRVWNALRAITAGRTASYADIARAIGAPSAVRAVGAANGANPVALIVPCHRIIGSTGALTGYGGGLDRKRWLLAHESGLGLALLQSAQCKT